MLKNNSLFSQAKYDLPAGLVVFLVALPLCLGIALASGAPLFSGIIAGIVGGIVIGSLSGSHVAVSGPAAGLTVIVLTAIEDLGSFQGFLLAVVLAGAIQFILGILRAGIIGHYFPTSVIKGMLAAIGLILILKQIPHAFGYDADAMGDQNFEQADGYNTFTELLHAYELLSPGAILISILSLVILILWDNPKLKSKFALFNYVPGALIVVFLGVLINYLYGLMAPQWLLGGEHLVTLPKAQSLQEVGGLLTFPDWSFFSNSKLYVAAVTIAIIASLETLLSLEASDKLDPQKRNSPTNRELKAQGIGNMVSGLIGGLPITAVIVRSSANVAAGSRTKMSAVYHGIFLMVCVLLIPGLLNMIPLASLAAVLLMVGYKLAKVSLFKQMYRLGWAQFMPFIVTIVAILFTDLLKGIGVGMIFAIFYILRNNYRTPYEYQGIGEGDEKEVINIKLAEDVSFLNKGSMLLTLTALPENSHVVIDASRSKNIDYDVWEIIDNFKITAQTKNINLEIKGLDPAKIV